MANWYVDSAATGANNGTSWADAWTSFGAIVQSGLAAGDIVWVRAGTYDERFAIAKSGSAGSRISYVGYGPVRPVLRGINGGTYTDIAVINLEFTQLSSANNYSAIKLSAGSARWLIRDNYFRRTYYSGIDGSTTLATVRRNLFDDVGGIGGGYGDGSNPNNISLSGDYNLVEYNYVLRGMDRVRMFGTGLVCRNNFFGPTDTAMYPSGTQYPSHTDDFQSWDTPFAKVLIERNFSRDNLDSIGGTNSHGFLYQLTVLASNQKQLLFRNNVTWDVGGGAFGLRSMDNTYVWNNTWCKIQNGSTSTSQQAQGYEAPNPGGNAVCNISDVRNNTLTDSPKCLNSGSSRGFYGPYDLVSYVTNWTHGTNHTYAYGGTEATYPTLSAASPANLAKADPLFLDRANGDFHLTPTSPLRAAGSNFVKAVGSGSGSTSLTVSDAYPISDGFGVVDGDWIKIGSGAYVQVASVNYATNVVTLSEARTWSNNDAVYVKGTEDVGALPYGTADAAILSVSTASAGGTKTATITVADSGNVRFVEILQDGYPVGSSSSPSGNVYTVSWPDDGQAHTVVARAYNLWASQSPVVETVVSSASQVRGVAGSLQLAGASVR